MFLYVSFLVLILRMVNVRQFIPKYFFNFFFWFKHGKRNSILDKKKKNNNYNLKKDLKLCNFTVYIYVFFRTLLRQRYRNFKFD